MRDISLSIVHALRHPLRAWRTFTQTQADHADGQARAAGLTVEVLPGGMRRYRDPRLDQLAAYRASQAAHRCPRCGQVTAATPQRLSPQRRSQPAGARRSRSRPGGRRDPVSTLAPTTRAACAGAAFHPDAGRVNAAERAGDGENLATNSRTAAAGAAGSPPGGAGAYQGRSPASSRSAHDRFQTLRGNHHAVPA